MRLRSQRDDNQMHKGSNRDIACGQQSRLRRNWRILHYIGRQDGYEENRCLRV